MFHPSTCSSQGKCCRGTIWSELPRQKDPSPRETIKLSLQYLTTVGGGQEKDQKLGGVPTLHHRNNQYPQHTSTMICRPWGVMFLCSRLVSKSSRAHTVSRYKGWKESQATSPMHGPTSFSDLTPCPHGNSNTSWKVPSSPSGSGGRAMTLCKQLWITSACACSSNTGSKLLSSRLRAPLNEQMMSSPACSLPETTGPAQMAQLLPCSQYFTHTMQAIHMHTDPQAHCPQRGWKGYTRYVQASMAFFRMGVLRQSGGSALMNSLGW